MGSWHVQSGRRMCAPVVGTRSLHPRSQGGGVLLARRGFWVHSREEGTRVGRTPSSGDAGASEGAEMAGGVGWGFG